MEKLRLPPGNKGQSVKLVQLLTKITEYKFHASDVLEVGESFIDFWSALTSLEFWIGCSSKTVLESLFNVQCEWINTRWCGA